jgi:hypothetical protein
MPARRTNADQAPTATRPNASRGATAILFDLRELLGGIPHLPGAACRGRPEWFDLESDDDPELIERAELVCRSCPALVRCTDWIKATPQRRRPSGVVAGKLRKPPQPQKPRPPKPKPVRPLNPLRPTMADAAADWLTEHMRSVGGSGEAVEIKAAARLAGFTAQTLNTGAKRLGIIRTRSGQRTFTWRLPGPGPAATEPDRTLVSQNGFAHGSGSRKTPQEVSA